MYKKNKYRNCRVTIDDRTFDSRKEYTRYCQLLVMQQDGEISDLELQRVFKLVPKQMLETPRLHGNKYQRCEQEITYIADFCYKDKEGKLVVEDTKSKATRTPQYIIKRKLMKFIHNIEIVEL